MKSLNKTLESFKKYIKDADSAALKEHMAYYDNHRAKLKKHFHTITINNAAVIENIKKLLEEAQIDKAIWDTKFFMRQDGELTIYNFLQKIKKNQKHNILIEPIIKIIDKKESKLTDRILMGMTALILLVAAIVFLDLDEALLQSLEALLQSSAGLPLLGLVYTIASSLYSMYSTQTDKKKPLAERLIDNAFLLANTSINVIAYGLWIGLSTTMAPVVASLFVLASAVDVIKALYYLRQYHLHEKRGPEFLDAHSLAVHNTSAHFDAGLVQYKNAVIINLSASAALVVIMAGWCFIPGGLPITIAAIATIAVVHAIKTWAIRHTEYETRKLLKIGLENIRLNHRGTVSLLDENTHLNPPTATSEIVPTTPIPSSSTTQSLTFFPPFPGEPQLSSSSYVPPSP